MSCWTGINSTGYRRPFQLDPIAIEKLPAKGILFILLQINGIKWEGTSPESITYGKTLPLIIDRPAIKKKLVGQEVTDGMTNRERKWIKELLNFAADEIGK